MLGFMAIRHTRHSAHAVMYVYHHTAGKSDVDNREKKNETFFHSAKLVLIHETPINSDPHLHTGIWVIRRNNVIFCKLPCRYIQSVKVFKTQVGSEGFYSEM